MVWIKEAIIFLSIAVAVLHADQDISSTVTEKSTLHVTQHDLNNTDLLTTFNAEEKNNELSEETLRVTHDGSDQSTVSSNQCACDDTFNCPCLQGLITTAEEVYSTRQYILSGNGEYATIASDMLQLTNNCYIDINGIRYNETYTGSSILNNNIKMPVTIEVEKLDKSCSWTISYRVYNIKTITNLTGTISTQNIDGDSSATLWVVNCTSEGVVSINMNVTMLELSVTGDLVDTMHEYTLDDYLIIGSGKNLLMENERIFFGKLNKTPLRLIINSPVSHVYFYLNDDAMSSERGFQLHYAAITKSETTTSAPTSTSFPKPSSGLQDVTTWAAIDGLHISQADNYTSTFRNFIADITNEYADNENIYLQDNITASDVYIHDAKGCIDFKCSSDCVAYNFSISCMDESGIYIFNSTSLQSILMDDQTFTNGKIQANCKDCNICDERRAEVSWTWLKITVLVMLGCAVLMSVLIMAVARKRRHDSTKFHNFRNRGSSIASSDDVILPWHKFTQPFDVNIDVSDFSHLEGNATGRRTAFAYQQINDPLESSTGHTNFGAINDEDTVEFSRVHSESRPDSATELAYSHPLGKQGNTTNRRLPPRLGQKSPTNPATAVHSDDDNDVVKLRKPQIYRSITPTADGTRLEIRRQSDSYI